jgi:hypothetical protein
LLHANLLSRNARIVITGSEAARGDIPSFSYTDVAQLAAKNHHDDLTAAVEALSKIPNGIQVLYPIYVVSDETYARLCFSEY